MLDSYYLGFLPFHFTYVSPCVLSHCKSLSCPSLTCSLSYHNYSFPYTPHHPIVANSRLAFLSLPSSHARSPWHELTLLSLIPVPHSQCWHVPSVMFRFTFLRALSKASSWVLICIFVSRHCRTRYSCAFDYGNTTTWTHVTTTLMPRFLSPYISPYKVFFLFIY